MEKISPSKYHKTQKFNKDTKKLLVPGKLYKITSKLNFIDCSTYKDIITIPENTILLHTQHTTGLDYFLFGKKIIFIASIPFVELTCFIEYKEEC